MRVIGGALRSRRIKSLPGLDLRPTPDRLREALFNILSTVIEGAVFVDAYAGTGAVGIEALSRGASKAVFIETSRRAADVIRDNLASLDLADRSLVLQAKASACLNRYPADIIFLDPPYSQQQEYELALGASSAPLVIAQHATRFELPEVCGNLRRERILKQGDNSLSFYRLVSDDASLRLGDLA